MKLLKLIFMSNVLIICSLGLLYYPLAVAPFCGLSFLRPRGLCGAHLGVACWSLHICRCTPLQSLAHTRARPFSYRFSPASPTLKGTVESLAERGGSRSRAALRLMRPRP